MTYVSGFQVQNVPQIKWVTDEDLVAMGLSKPEIRRLKKFFSKYCPQNYLSKMKRVSVLALDWDGLG